MARWRLKQKHYLHVPGTEWEYKETTNTGRQVRKVFQVPLFLDPDYPADCNYGPGECIVAHEGKGALPKDYIFTGPPTPEMEPLDDEAREISARESPKWIAGYLIGNDEGDYSAKLLTELTETLQSFNATSKPSSMAAEPGDDIKKRLDELMEMNRKLMEQNMALMGKMEPTTGSRRL